MKKTYFIPILVFISFAVIVYLVFPSYRQMRGLRADIAQTERNLQLTEDYFSEVKRISAELRDYQEVFEIVDVALPQDPGLASLMSFFQTEASTNGLVVLNMGLGNFTFDKQEEAAKKSEIEEVSIGLSLAGSLSAFENFLRRIEKSSRLFELQGFTFQGEEAEGKSLQFDLTVRTYSY